MRELHTAAGWEGGFSFKLHSPGSTRSFLELSENFLTLVIVKKFCFDIKGLYSRAQCPHFIPKSSPGTFHSHLKVRHEHYVQPY